MCNKKISHEVCQEQLDSQFFTHMHSCEFWGALGRAVATFSLLEEILGKAIFSYEITAPRTDSDMTQEAYEQWLKKLEKCLTDTLAPLIQRYKNAVTNNIHSTTVELDDMVDDLKDISTYRNVLCHGSWRNPPDSNGATIPYFFNRSMKQFDTPIDVNLLNKIQSDTAHLICSVINSVTRMGWKFPGSDGPGKKII